ncbi:glycosyltransferase family 2 protein [Flavobacterium sp. NRK F10]|uniref:Glycosyltransferase 2-like domain-containing protein n=1 Tax=Flavobacterium sediminis TaxID=2201181 RepID=A0A2U8QR89_9FLAO|nr:MULTISPECIES: glycosyltransferase family A protein [Flavobacterium]AWM12629.1 hypothetical protein DI487_01260 [Flavobacterium sediminis]MCO6173747.1 glycosyltransferase family 2 protein [Flavobacterium sp. NRK F10]
MLYQQNDLEILVSTMNQKDLGFLYRMFPDDLWQSISVLVVNQTDGEELQSGFENVKVVNCYEFGLSKSRNIALQQAEKDLVLLADDDVIFEHDFAAKLLHAFNKNPFTDVVRFRYTQNGKQIKKYPQAFCQDLNWFQVLDISSVELAFKRKVILETNVRFDENFGIGACFPIGEEAIFVSDLKNKNFRISGEPEVILDHPGETTSKRINSEMLYFNQSAVFFRIFRNKYVLWIFLKLFFDLKQGKIGILQIPKLISQAIKGKKQYVKNSRL